jgi:hypothetical protein
MLYVVPNMEARRAVEGRSDSIVALIPLYARYLP